MLDKKFILENWQLVEKNSRLRGIKVDIKRVKSLIEEYYRNLQEIENLRAQINKLTEVLKKEKDKQSTVIQKARALKTRLKKLEKEFHTNQKILDKEIRKIPNLTHPQAPIGDSDNDNREIERIGIIPKFNFIPKDHLTLGKGLAILDFEAGARTSGPKFYFLKNEGVWLELALIRYALETLAKEGFQLFITPELAKLDIIEGTGFVPRGPATQIYKIEGADLGLIATAEITLAGLYTNETLEIDDLPLKLGGLSHCFRREAGTYGRASKGLYRVHQFTKVEMFIFSKPEESEKMLDFLVAIEKKIFSGLGIPFRVVDCCSGDLGASAYRKFDLEAWLPAEKRWGEITSASNCTDYQARRLNIKMKDKKGGKEFVHTLNATALATSRTIIAILENFQQKDGSVLVPKVLQKWFGQSRIIPK